MCYKKTVSILVFIFTMTTGCSMLNHIVYRPDINQGNYLDTVDIAKLHVGMKKQQIAYILGMPIMDTVSNSGTWYYIFRKKFSHEKILQQTLTLTFNDKDILTNIDNKLNVIGS